MNSVDEIKCSNSNTYDFEAKMAEMELQYQKQKEQDQLEFSLPLHQRILSKNWKCRKSAIDEFLTLINDLTIFDYEIFKLFPKFSEEQHQGNLENAIEIINRFLDKNFHIPLTHQNILNDTIKNLIEKGFTSNKISIKEKSKDAIIKCVENLSTSDLLCETINKLLESKNQKFVQGAIAISTLLLSLFGSTGFAYSKMIHGAIKIIDNCSPLIKNEIITFICELYKWIRGGIRQYIDNKIAESTRNDIDKNCQTIAQKFEEGFIPKATKFLNKNSGIFENNNKTNVNIIDKKKTNQQIDNNISDDSEIDVFNNKFGFGEKFAEEIMQPEKKWKDKKEMLDDFAKNIHPNNVLKIKNTNRIFFIEMLKKLLKDPNINVIHSIIICINYMAKGLRSDFTEARDFFSILIEFFKEKKEKLTNDLMQTLESLYTYLDDTVLCDLILKYTSQNITVQSKEKICILIDNIANTKLNIRPLVDKILVKYTDDASQEVRNASIKALGSIKNKNRNALIGCWEMLNEAKQKKINDYVEHNNSNNHDEMMASELPCNNINNNSNNIAMNNTSNNVGAGQQKNNKKKGDNDKMEEDTNDQSNEIEDYIKAQIGNEIFNNFNDPKWNIRKDAFMSLSTYILNNPNEIGNNIDFWYKFIQLKTKNFKENNMNIYKEAIQSIQNLNETYKPFSKKYASILLKKIIDKISDAKAKPNIHLLIDSLIKTSNAKYITSTLIKTTENKSTAILKEVAIYINAAIEKHGINLFPVKEIVDYCKELEANSNSMCRNSGTTLLCTLYKYIGEPLKSLLKDVKEATMKNIEKEFEKIKQVASEQGNNNTNNNQKENNELIDSLFPKVDLSKKITSKMLKDLSEGKWQLKKEIIEQIESFITEANNRILSNGLNELMTILKRILKDSNKNIVRFVLQLIIHFTDALGVSMKIYVKNLLQPIIKNLSDKMDLLRKDTVKCLEKFIEVLGFDMIANSFPQFLSEENFELRSELLKILIKYKNNLQKFENIKEFIPGTISCLLDKNPVIRTMGEEFAKEILRYVNINAFYNLIVDFKPAIANSVKNIISKYSSLICVNNNNDGNIEMKDCTQGERERAVSLKNVKKNKNPGGIMNQQDDVIMKHETSKSNNHYDVNNAVFNKDQLQRNNTAFPGQLGEMPNINVIKKNNIINIQNQQKQLQQPPNILNNNNNNTNFQMPPTLLPNNNNNTNNTSNNISYNSKNNRSLPVSNFELSKSPFCFSKTKTVFNSNKVSQSGASSQSRSENSVHIEEIISSLNSNDSHLINSAILEIDYILANLNFTYIQVFREELSRILESMNSLLNKCAPSNSNTISNDSTLFFYLLTTYFNLAMKKEIISDITLPIDSIYKTYENILKKLDSDNHDKINKAISQLMLKLLENFNITNTYCALIKLISNYKKNTSELKVCQYSIKCVLKLNNVFHKLYERVNIENVLIQIIEYVKEYENTEAQSEKSKIEEYGLKTIQAIVYVIIKQIQGEIWNVYNNIFKKYQLTSNLLKQWIQIIFKNNGDMLVQKPTDVINNINNNNNNNNKALLFPSTSNVIPSNMCNNINPLEQKLTKQTYNMLNQNKLPDNNNPNINKTNNSILNINNNNISKTSKDYSPELNRYITQYCQEKNPERKNTYAYEIIHYINRINVPFYFLSTEMDGENFQELFKIYSIIKPEDSKPSIKSKSNPSVASNTSYNNTNINNPIPVQTKPNIKTLAEYRQEQSNLLSEHHSKKFIPFSGGNAFHNIENNNSIFNSNHTFNKNFYNQTQHNLLQISASSDNFRMKQLNTEGEMLLNRKTNLKDDMLSTNRNINKDLEMLACKRQMIDQMRIGKIQM